MESTLSGLRKLLDRAQSTDEIHEEYRLLDLIAARLQQSAQYEEALEMRRKQAGLAVALHGTESIQSARVHR